MFYQLIIISKVLLYKQTFFFMHIMYNIIM